MKDSTKNIIQLGVILFIAVLGYLLYNFLFMFVAGISLALLAIKKETSTHYRAFTWIGSGFFLVSSISYLLVWIFQDRGLLYLFRLGWFKYYDILPNLSYFLLPYIHR